MPSSLRRHVSNALHNSPRPNQHWPERRPAEARALRRRFELRDSIIECSGKARASGRTHIELRGWRRKGGVLAFSDSSNVLRGKPIRSSNTVFAAMEASHAQGFGAETSGSNTRQFVSSLISAIPATAQDTSPNPLKEVPPATKSIFLTLYALFEKEWLPALDLLDRSLVTRVKVKASSNDNSSTKQALKDGGSFFLVRTAQQHSTRNTYEHVSYYEVRLKAWSCSCPAFTFAAFPASTSASDTRAGDNGTVSGGGRNLMIGGLTLGNGMPVCKHLLGCVLIEHCQMFKHFEQEREVTLDELAGWAAGWGD